jgi:hypothetical protein
MMHYAVDPLVNHSPALRGGKYNIRLLLMTLARLKAMLLTWTTATVTPALARACINSCIIIFSACTQPQTVVYTSHWCFARMPSGSSVCVVAAPAAALSAPSAERGVSTIGGVAWLAASRPLSTLVELLHAFDGCSHIDG